jgi:hypothetical protein
MSKHIVTFSHGCVSGDMLCFFDHPLPVRLGHEYQVRIELAHSGEVLDACAVYEVGNRGTSNEELLLAVKQFRPRDIPEGSTIEILRAENDG